eukprot:2736336-Pyramimonas_sp.AAC.1
MNALRRQQLHRIVLGLSPRYARWGIHAGCEAVYVHVSPVPDGRRRTATARRCAKPATCAPSPGMPCRAPIQGGYEAAVVLSSCRG